ncbi:hypothetical protein MSIMFI_02283 [Mycobacterium simulans]|uniref:NAD-binding protein n=1 Tax=Mycobacterium simulans TaxID=627089 RepID=UPI001749D638|nr:NAD-binding protein [Mycobacterium simulans]SON60782.1 hypothetical protein MSIMFI_02283 [Mycobacterium simulans]
MRVGFIGLGSQGGPMARRIVEAGHPTTLWARRPATLEPFAANLGTAATALSLGKALGVSPQRLTEVVARSSGNSFALNAIGDTGNLDRLARVAGGLLRKDVRLVVDLAEAAAARGGAVLAAADAALTLMEHPR